MAELGIAATAIGLAATGLNVARFLKSYADTVRTVDKKLTPVASQVQITSTTLDNIGALFKDSKFQGIFTDKVLEDTKDALSGCCEAFNDLEVFVASLMKLDGSGKAHISNASMFTFYFKEKELDALQARLERFKTSLVLVLEVLNLRLLMKAAKDTNIIEDQRREISRLLEAENEAKKRQVLTDRQIQDLLQQPCGGDLLEHSSAVPKDTSTTATTLEPSQHTTQPQTNVAAVSPDSNNGTAGKDTTATPAKIESLPAMTARDQELFDALRLCSESANDLSDHVKLSLSIYQKMQEAKHCGLIPSISATKRFFPAISLLAQKLDVYDQHFDWTKSIIEGNTASKLRVNLAARPTYALQTSQIRASRQSKVQAEEKNDTRAPLDNAATQAQESSREPIAETRPALDVDTLLKRWTIPFD